MASATKDSPDIGSGSTQAFQQPCSISWIILRFREISPPRRLSREGIRPGFLTMYCSRVSRGDFQGEGVTCRHQVFWVSSNRVEFQTGFGDEIRKDIVCCYANTMITSL